MRKGSLCPEAFSFQKKDGRTWPRPSSLWHDTDFSEKTTTTTQKLKQSISYQKKDGRGYARPSFFRYDNDSGHKGPFRVMPPTVIFPDFLKSNCALSTLSHSGQNILTLPLE